MNNLIAKMAISVALMFDSTLGLMKDRVLTVFISFKNLHGFRTGPSGSGDFDLDQTPCRRQ